jgi:hypothetical protein
VRGELFLVFGMASAVAAASAPGVTPWRRVVTVVSATCLLVAAVGFGMFRLAYAPDAPTVRVALVAVHGDGGVAGVGTPEARFRMAGDLPG